MYVSSGNSIYMSEDMSIRRYFSKLRSSASKKFEIEYSKLYIKIHFVPYIEAACFH